MRDICRNKQNQCLSNIDKSKTRGPFCMENRLGHAHYDDVYIEMYRQMLLRAWPFWGWFPYKQGDVGLNVPNSFPYPWVIDFTFFNSLQKKHPFPTPLGSNEPQNHFLFTFTAVGTLFGIWRLLLTEIIALLLQCRHNHGKSSWVPLNHRIFHQLLIQKLDLNNMKIWHEKIIIGQNTFDDKKLKWSFRSHLLID